MEPPQRNPQGRSGPWILQWHQLTLDSPRLRYRVALSQFAWPGSWRMGCSEYPGDTVWFWHSFYLPDKHSCPQQRGISCFWNRVQILSIQCRVLRQAYLQCVTTGYSHILFNLWWKCKFLGPLSAPLLFMHVTFPTTCWNAQHVHCPAEIPYCPPAPAPSCRAGQGTATSHQLSVQDCTATHNSILLRAAVRHQARLQVSTQGPCQDIIWRLVREDWSSTRNWKLIFEPESEANRAMSYPMSTSISWAQRN